MGLTPRQYEMLQARVHPVRARPTPVIAADLRATRLTPHRVVLGIDPSLRATGWGIIQVERNIPKALGWGTLASPSALPRTQCLVRIAAGLRDAIRQHGPTTCAIEGLFFAQNLQTALIMGEARGVCLLAAAEAGLEICEIAPRKVKQAIVGFGGAQKLAVARMVQRILHLGETPDPDASDALAIALVHAREVARPTLELPRRL